MSLCLSTEVQASTGTTSPASKNNRHSKVGWIRSRVRQSDVKVVNNTHTTTHSLEGGGGKKGCVGVPIWECSQPLTSLYTYN